MDSRLKKIAVFTCFVVILCAGIAVVLANYNDVKVRISTVADTSGGVLPKQEVPEEERLKDFMKDNTFFDKDPEDSLLDTKSSGHMLDLLVTSVEKDLRVKIVDLTGNPVTGVEFCINVEGSGEYNDIDRDGIIYAADLAAGEYYVSLKEVPGYQVPATRVKVAVREKVEYVLIDDISYFILSEDQVDAKVEDTEINGALEDADGTEIDTPVLEEGSEFGIDVSKWNKEIDWQRVKEAGVQYAIIRCGYRGSQTGSLVEDPYFVKNIEGAAAAGVKTGIYFFTQAVNEVEAVEEASMVLTLCRQYKLDYPIFIDTEGAGGNGRADALSKEIRTSVCKAFAETIKNAGFTPGVYASKNWFNNNLETSVLEEYAIWLAEYKNEPTYTGNFHMWQYTSGGSVDGIEGRVDLNISLLR